MINIKIFPQIYLERTQTKYRNNDSIHSRFTFEAVLFPPEMRVSVVLAVLPPGHQCEWLDPCMTPARCHSTLTAVLATELLQNSLQPTGPIYKLQNSVQTNLLFCSDCCSVLSH